MNVSRYTALLAALLVVVLLPWTAICQTPEQLLENALQAREEGDFQRAGDLLLEAAEVYRESGQPETVAQLYQYAARAYLQGGNYQANELTETGLTYLRRSADLYLELDDKKEAAQLLLEQGMRQFGLTRWAAAEETLTEAYRLSQDVEGLDPETNYLLVKYLAQAVDLSHRWPEALTLYEETIRLAHQVAPEDLPDLRLTLATIHSLLNQVDEAHEAYRQASAGFLQAGREKESREARFRLGLMLQQRHRYEEALPVWNELLRQYPAGDPDALQAAFRKAYTLEGLGRYEEALELLTASRQQQADPAARQNLDARRVKLLWLAGRDREARALLESPVFEDDFARAEAAYNASKPEVAVHYYETYLATASGPDRPTLLNSVAYRYLLLGRAERARKLLREALELLPKEGEGELWATLKVNLGESYLKTGDPERALTHFEDALPWYEQHGEPASLAILLNNSAACDEKLGNLSEALSKLEKAVEIGDRFQKPEPIQATVVNALGYLNVRLGRYQDGIEYYKTALSLHHSRGNAVGERTVLFNLGAAQVLADEREEGYRNVIRAIELAGRDRDLELQVSILGFLAGHFIDGERRQNMLDLAADLLPRIENPQLKALVKVARARLYADSGAWEKAQREAEEALELVGREAHSEQAIAARDILFDRSVEANDLKAAEQIFQPLLEDVQVNLFGLSTREARTLVETRCRDFPEFAARLAGAGRLDRAFSVQETYHSLGLAALVRDVDLDAAPLSAELKKERELLSALLRKQAGSGDRALTASLMTRYRSVLDKIERQHLASGLVARIASVEVKDVQAELKPGEALLQYIVGEHTAHLLLIKPQSMKGYPIGAPTELQEKTRRVLHAILRRRPLAQVGAETAALQASILAPALPELSDTQRLVIVPAGPLFSVPFAALPAGEGYLVDRFDLTVANSASSWMVSRNTGAGGHGTLVAALGDVSGSEEHLTPLPATSEEAKAVHGLMPRPQLFLAEEMLSERMRSHSIGKEHLHFATHGVLDVRQPLLSGLECFDRRITAADIFGWHLNARLAVLSACNSGSLPRGNGYLGLSSAFQYAGVRTLVVSLWPVADESTRYWMEQFYEGMKNGLTPSEATSAAHKTTREKWEHPYFWAPFTTWGDGLTG